MLTLEQRLEIEKTIRILERSTKEDIISFAKNLMSLKYAQESLIKELLIPGSTDNGE